MSKSFSGYHETRNLTVGEVRPLNVDASRSQRGIYPLSDEKWIADLQLALVPGLEMVPEKRKQLICRSLLVSAEENFRTVTFWTRHDLILHFISRQPKTRSPIERNMTTQPHHAEAYKTWNLMIMIYRCETQIYIAIHMKPCREGSWIGHTRGFYREAFHSFSSLSRFRVSANHFS